MIRNLSTFLIFFLLQGASSFAQVDDYSEIKSDDAFEKLYAQQRNLDNMKDALFDTAKYFQQINLLIEYSEKNKDLKRLVRAKFLYIFYFNKVLNDLEIIARGNELMAYPEFYELPLCVTVLDAVKQAYERNELFKEELDIIPILNREGNKWKPEVFSKRNVDADLAIVYFRLSNFEEAISKFKSRIEFHKENNNYYDLSGILNNCALAYVELGNSDSAYKYFQLAASYLDTILNSDFESKTRESYLIHFRKILKVNNLKNSPKKVSDETLKDAIQAQLYSAINERENHIVIASYRDLAKLAYNQGHFNQSLLYCDSALAIMKNYSNVKLYQAILRRKAKNHIRLGNSKEAEITLKLQEAFLDSIQIARTQNEHNIALVRFETRQKVQDLREARQEAEIEKRISKTRRIGLIATGILLLVTLILLNRVYISRIKAEKQVVVINTMLKEKNLLFKEVHHRIKNNLQMVSGLLDLHSLKIKHSEVDLLVSDTKRHIASMALVHQMLYQDDHFGAVAANTYFETLANNTLKGMGQHSISTNLEIEAIKLPLDKIIPIGLALCEMLVNTFKYAYPDKKGVIDISLKVSDGICSFSYADYGVGVDEDILNDENSNSIGSTLIDLLVEEIDGDLTIIHTNGLKYLVKYRLNDEGKS